MEKPTLASVDAYPVPEFLVARVARLNALSYGFAEGLVREAKRMLYLHHVSGAPVAPSDRIDLAWHEMLLFTKWYQEFTSYVGGFIHHDPTEPVSVESYLQKPYKPFSLIEDAKKSGEAPAYTKTKALYKEYFGEVPNPQYWP